MMMMIPILPTVGYFWFDESTSILLDMIFIYEKEHHGCDFVRKSNVF